MRATPWADFQFVRCDTRAAPSQPSVNRPRLFSSHAALFIAVIFYGPLMGSTRINLHGVTCLLADSEHYTRDLVAQMLRGFGLNQPILADTGKEAKEIFKHQCPELFITEAVLPDMSSADLIRWIRRLNGPIRFVPTIVLTGYTQLKTVASVRDGGANIVVKKKSPYRPTPCSNACCGSHALPAPSLKLATISVPTAASEPLIRPTVVSSETRTIPRSNPSPILNERAKTSCKK